MSYSTDIEAWDLRCRSEEDARRATLIFESDPWMRRRIVVAPVLVESPGGGGVWHLSIESCDPCYWNEEASQRVWAAIAPHMAEDTSLEFCNEDRERYRIRWTGQRAYIDVPRHIIWELEHEL